MLGVPLGLFIFLVQIAAGGAIVQAILDWFEPDVSPGYLQLNALFFLFFGGSGVALRMYLPVPKMIGHPVDEPWLGLEVAVWTAFLIAVVLGALAFQARRRTFGTRVGLLAALLGTAALSVTALAYAPPNLPGLVTVASLVGGALCLGTAWNGMMLGHWYLNTPRLAPRPLVRLNLAMATMLVVQASFVGGVVTLLLPELATSWMVWVRVGVGFLVPLLLSVPVHLTARVRSMMSATGLLYIALGAILAGELVARLTLFVERAPL